VGAVSPRRGSTPASRPNPHEYGYKLIPSPIFLRPLSLWALRTRKLNGLRKIGENVVEHPVAVFEIRGKRAMPRLRKKACDRCQNIAPVLYRAQLDATGHWFFICDICYPIVRQDNPYYTYGGTWKAQKS